MLINLQVRHIYIITLTGKTDISLHLQVRQISLHLQVRQIYHYTDRQDRYIITFTGKTDISLHRQVRQIYHYTYR